MKNRWTKFAVLAAIAVLVMSLGALAVFAQDDPVPETPEVPALPDGQDGFYGFKRGFHGRGHDFGTVNDEALAEALGITVEELQAARQKVAADRLAQAVEDGYLTQDEANLMIAMQALKGALDREAIMAEALGMTAEEFAAAHDDGTLREQLENITPAELSERMQSATQAAVQQAVTDDVITQAQADLVLENLAGGFGLRDGYGFSPHPGFGGGRGGHHDFHGGQQPGSDGEAFGPSRNTPNVFTFGA